MKKKKNLFSGIRKLLTPEQWSNIFAYASKKRGESDKRLKKHTKGLKKGPKVRGNNIKNQAKLNEEIILKEAKQIKKENPNINRQKLAADLEVFSQNLKKSGLSKKYLYSYIYRTILKDFS